MATDSVREMRSAVPEGLFEGNKLDQPTFHRLYEQTPQGFKAELIGGIVHVASPVGIAHNDPHVLVIAWLSNYAVAKPNTHVLDNATVILDDQSEPQPDAGLRYRQGTSRISDNRCNGPPELVIEVSDSTVVHDLFDKRADYERHGVSEYLVLAVEESRAIWFTRGDDGGFVELSPTAGKLQSCIFPGLWLDPDALFDLDHVRVMAVLNEGLASVGKSEEKMEGGE